MLEPSDWKTRLMLAFCNAKPIWMPKKPKLMFHSPAQPCRGLSIMASFIAFLPRSPPAQIS
ncbi:hypothetical protein [Novosphingobium panipatense]|uniref:hypothetical protein n=1 Tax=Novosphingobium panipatense TaxID=428991 RepID=UPI003609E228